MRQKVLIKPSPKFKFPKAFVYIVSFLCLICTSTSTFGSDIEDCNSACSDRLFTINVVGSGQPVLLIPGLMSSSSVYDMLISKLSQHFEFHIVSVKGFAGIPQYGEFSLDKLVEDLKAYIESEKLFRPHVVGHSMGGLTALTMAAEHSRLIGKVVSIDGLPFIGPIFTRNNHTTVAMLEQQAQTIKAMFENMTGEQMASQTQQQIYLQATSLAHQAMIVDMAKRSDPRTVGAAMFDVMTTDLREQLKASSTAILMLGASGAFTQKEQHEQVKSLYEEQFENVANSTVIMNATTRHFMMLDDVDWVSQKVKQFLSEE